ncbi:MAG: DUF4097 family beta strand repeat-containing protein [Ilumatobacteraceae bacterium]
MSRRETHEVGPHASLEIDVRTSAVEVRASVDERIQVDITGGTPDAWEIHVAGTRVSLREPTRAASRRARLYVEVPVGTDVEVRSTTGDVDLGGILGEVRVRSASGSVRADTVAGFEAHTATGDLRLGTCADEADATTVSGDVAIGTVGGRLQVSTASGDVRLDVVGDSARVGTTSGDVRLNRFDGADLSVKSVSGDISLGLPGGIRVEPDISTLSGRTRLPPPATTLAPPGGRRVVRVRLQSVSGDITIERAD